jgi:hypothetical protein
MNYYTKLSARIAALFIVAIAMTYVPEKLPDVFYHPMCEGEITSSPTQLL